MAIGTLIHGEDAAYYNTPCQFTGKVIETTKDASGRYLALKLLGTNLESLLTWGTGTTHHARVHLCPAECNQETVGPGLIHCKRYRAIGSLDELSGHPWRDVLVRAAPQDGDELAGLRGRMGGLPDQPEGEGGVKRKRSEKVENKGKDAKKKKKTRSRRGRKRSSCSGRRRKKRSRSGRSQRKGGDKEKRAAAGIGANSPGRSTSSSSTSSTWAYTPVDQKRMFARSGLDPVRRARNRKRRKAQRYAQRGRRTTGESKSSSSGEGAGLKGQTIFGEHQRVRAVGLNFPGVLSAQAIEDMQELMLTEAGQQTLQQDGWMPTLLRYYRQMLCRKVSGPMGREAHTLCTVGDLILRGHLPEAMDE